MSAPAQPGFIEAIRALRDGLRELGVPWVVIGGVAVIARGVPRFTADVDATLWAADAEPERVVEALRRHAIVPRIDDPIEFARQRQVLLLRHTPSGVPLDVSMAWLPFEEAAIQHGEICDFAGVAIPVARPEDLVIYKVVAARARDLDDVEALLLLHGTALDVGRIRRVVREFADALEDPTRVEELERLLRRAGLDRPAAG